MKVETHSTPSPQLNSLLQKTPIAIIGVSAAMPDAQDVQDYWDNIVAKKNSIKDVPPDRWEIEAYYDPNPSTPDKTYCKRGGFIPDLEFNPMEFGLPPNILEVTDASQLIGLLVAKAALVDAGYYNASKEVREKTGVVLGVGGGQKLIIPLTSRLQYPIWKKVLVTSGLSEADADVIVEKIKLAYVGWEENSFPGLLGNVISGRIANRFDLGGMNCVVDAACAGSLAAFKMAVSDLLEHRSDMMITGGVDTDNSIFMYMSFSKTPAFSQREFTTPFDAETDGMMIGEGVGMVVLKRLEDAVRDGDRIYAVVRGIGVSSDGKFKSIYAPRPAGQSLALMRAYDDAGFSPATIGLMEAHGTGTAAGDPAEFEGIKQIFNAATNERKKVALGSVKSQIGHTKAAAGAASLVKVALAIYHKILPPTIGVNKPNPKFNIDETPFYINTQTRPWIRAAGDTPRRAGVSSFGFGGTNFHVVLEEYQEDHNQSYRLHRPAEMLLFSAPTPADLKTQLQQALSALQGENFHQQFLNLAENSQKMAVPATHARLGFVADSAAEAAELLQQALTMLDKQPQADKWAHPKGLFYQKSGRQPNQKVVALFPGQGSQYVEMGRELALNYPEVRQAWGKIDTLFKQEHLPPLSKFAFPAPAFLEAEREAQNLALRQTEHAQPAIGTLSYAMYQLLYKAGFRPDFTAGHSFGELTALWAGGVLDDEGYFKLIKARGKAMAPPAGAKFDTGAMLAVKGDATQVQAEARQLPNITLANLNSPQQTILAGPTEAIKQAQQTLTNKGYNTVLLPVSAAFHTPLVGHAQREFAQAIEEVAFHKPQLPIYANETGLPYPHEPITIRQMLEAHVLNPVLFRQQIENMYTAGAYFFVEIGPKTVLTNLVKETLGNKPHLAVAFNPSSSKPDDRQFREAFVQLRVAGLELAHFDPYQAHLVRDTGKKALSVKINGSNYVSDKTRQAFRDALQDGFKISSAGKANGAAVAVKAEVKAPVAVVQELKPEVVTPPTPPTPTPLPAVAPVMATPVVAPIVEKPQPVVATPAAAPALNHLQDELQKLFALQDETLAVHEQFLSHQLQNSQTLLSLFQQLTGQQSGAENLLAFHNHQAETARVHEQYLRDQMKQARLLVNMLGTEVGSPNLPAAPLAPQPPAALPTPSTYTNGQHGKVESAPLTYTPMTVESEQLEIALSAPKPEVVATPVPVVSQPVAAQPSALSTQHSALTSAMLEIVSEKTGYPAEMLELSMDMEADLGIDSIKRVEILGGMQDRFPDLPPVKPEELAELRTLGEIVTYMANSGGAVVATPALAAPVASQPAATPHSPLPTPSANTEKLTSAMLEIVSEKTGYPAEMLELSMDMEADLGIDSIKRVEILGGMQDRFPDLPPVKPEELAELRTLGEIVTYMANSGGAVIATPAPAAPVVSQPAATPHSPLPTPSANTEKLTSAMLEIVSEKTGYPAEMLELSMDMEADLGIDSIKRVEILGGMQDRFPDLPPVKPEELAELRTLGEIVTYMANSGGAVVATPAPAAPVITQPAVAQPVIAPAQPSALSTQHSALTSAMLEIVSEKTGYPAEMLELSMDMEADLGIDSIKRVEILGGMQDRFPDLPPVKPEELAELRTLGEIVTYMANSGGAVVATPALAAPVASQPAATPHSPLPTPSANTEKLTSAMLEIVSEKTGYPAEMLELSMDMEADLGIDSIKRVEILGGMQDRFPDLPPVKPEELAELRTLGEIVTYMANSGGAVVATPALAAPVASQPAATPHSPLPTPSANTEKLTSAMLEIVSEKTGYPAEMLELSMDMEADLGIDSIKRVEILGGMQDRFPDLPPVKPEELAELRTLGEIVTYMANSGGAVVATPAPAAPVITQPAVAQPVIAPAQPSALSTQHSALTSAMLEIVSEKTGYPAEMLELSMDMEADLGIDSIKRVEILGGMQDRFPDLPPVKPEELAELRTLGEIVNYMAKSGEGEAFFSNAPASNVTAGAVSPAQPAVSQLPAWQGIVKRHEVRVKSLPAPDQLQIHLPAGYKTVITDEGSELTVHLAQALQQKGWPVVVLSFPNQIISQQRPLPAGVQRMQLADLSETTLQNQLQALGPVAVFIHLNPETPVPAGQVVLNGVETDIAKHVFLMAKYLQPTLNKAAEEGFSAFVTVARLDGAFGFRQNTPFNPIGSGLFGLTKSAKLEWPHVFCRAIDLGRGLNPQQAAGFVVAELHDPNRLLNEVGYSANGRVTLAGH